MNFRLYCEFSDTFRALSVTGMGLSRTWQFDSERCLPARKIPLIGFCGSQVR